MIINPNTAAKDSAPNLEAGQSRLNPTVPQLTISRENLTAANSRFMDVGIAGAATEYARQNILVQSGTAMPARANAVAQSALRLWQ